MTSASVTLDLHGKNKYRSRIAIDAALRRSRGVYRIRIIHGCNSGSELRDMVRSEYGRAKGVLRLDISEEGATTLILREL